MPGLLSWVVTVIRSSNCKALDVVPGPRSNIRHPLSVFPSFHRVPRDRFPGFIGTTRVLRLPAVRPAALRFLRLAIPRLHSLGFAPRRASAPPRPGVGRPVSPAGMLPRRRQDLPSSWGISLVRLHMFLPTPAGLLAPDHYGAAAWPLDPQVQRLPRKVFRRPIAWLSDSLSTPRRADYSDPTQDSLPVVGQALPDGLSTQKIPMRGFKIVSFLSSSPRLCLAQWGRPTRLGISRSDTLTI